MENCWRHSEIVQTIQTSFSNKLFTKKNRGRGTEICAVSISTASHTNTNLFLDWEWHFEMDLIQKGLSGCCTVQPALCFMNPCTVVCLKKTKNIFTYRICFICSRHTTSVWKYRKQKQKLKLNHYLRDTHRNCTEELVLRRNIFGRKNSKMHHNYQQIAKK